MVVCPCSQPDCPRNRDVTSHSGLLVNSPEGLWPTKGPTLTVPFVLASVRPVVAPAPLHRRAVAVFGVAGLALTSMAVGLGLAFPGGIGSRSGQGAGVTPILVTPARQAQPAGTTSAQVSVLANETSSVPAAATT